MALNWGVFNKKRFEEKPQNIVCCKAHAPRLTSIRVLDLIIGASRERVASMAAQVITAQCINSRADRFNPAVSALL